MTFNLTHGIAILRHTPAVLDPLLRDLPDALLRCNEGVDSFAPFDVLGHLIDGEETDWITRARLILTGGAEPHFVPYDRFRHRSRNVGRSVASLLDEFARLRAANLEELIGWQLSDAQLALIGIHPTFGRVTFRQLLAAWVVHDLGHVAQIARVIAKQHREAVGPWLAFLPVLTDRPVPAT